MSQPPAVSIPDNKRSESIFFYAKAPDSALGILTEYVLGNVRPPGLPQRAPTEDQLLSGWGMESRVQEGTPAQYATKGRFI